MAPKNFLKFLIAAGALIAVADFVAAQQVAPQASSVVAVSSVSPRTETDPSKPLPNAKEVLEMSEKAVGGKEAWAKFSTRRLKGIYQTQDSSEFFAIEILQKSPNKSLYKLTFPNDIIVRDVCDGRSAWIEDPRGGYHEFSGVALNSRLRRSEFLNRSNALLLAVTGKVLGIEKVGTHSAYVLEYSPLKDVTSKVYVDADSGFIVRAQDNYKTPDGPYVITVDLDDYRDVDGLKIPFRLKTTEKGAIFNIRLTQVKNDAPIDDSVFLKPTSAPKQ